VRFRTVNVAVQGALAVPQVVAALRELDGDPEVEVIVVARGGGSVEDLLPFSDETLCRAVAACRTPVISAIGHEPDTPLIDFVADVRASTPTDAGKRVVPDVADEQRRLGVARQRLRSAVTGRLDREAAALAALRSRPVLARPYLLLDAREDDVAALRDRARRCLSHLLAVAATDLEHRRASVRALSPAATLERGYAVVHKQDGGVVRRPADVTAGEDVRLRLAEGNVDATVR